MRASQLKQYESKIVTLDLINGIQLTLRLTEVNEDDGEVVGENPIAFQLQVVMGQAGRPEGRITASPYGAPIYKLPKTVRVDAAHILFVLDPPKEMVDMYVAQTSGIVPAAGGVLDTIKNFDPSAFANLAN